MSEQLGSGYFSELSFTYEEKSRFSRSDEFIRNISEPNQPRLISKLTSSWGSFICMAPFRPPEIFGFFQFCIRPVSSAHPLTHSLGNLRALFSYGLTWNNWTIFIKCPAQLTNRFAWLQKQKAEHWLMSGNDLVHPSLSGFCGSESNKLDRCTCTCLFSPTGSIIRCRFITFEEQIYDQVVLTESGNNPLSHCRWDQGYMGGCLEWAD